MAPESRPQLRRGVRLTYDKVRETHVLLFPEGVLVPNGTAAAVLEHCDGRTTVATITERLAARYDGVRVQDIIDLLDRLIQRRIVSGAVPEPSEDSEVHDG